MPIDTLAGRLVDDAGNIAAATLAATGLLTGSDVAVAGAGMGSLVHSQSATVARTDTVAKNLFTLPANAFITRVAVYVPTASDAVTTATVSVGKSGGTGTEYLNAQDVKGAGTGMISSGAKTIPGTVGGSAVTVTGTYAESGGASTTGGPFTVIIEYRTR